MAKFIVLIYRFLSVLVPMLISAYCTTTLPQDLRNLKIKPAQAQTQKQPDIISNVTAESARVDLLIKDKQIEFIENKFDDLYKIAMNCLDSEAEIIHLKEELIVKRKKMSQPLDSAKFEIKARTYTP